MKNQLLLFLCLFSIAMSQAQTFNDGVLQYTVTDATNGYVSVNKIGTTCPPANFDILGWVNYNGVRYTVTSIEDNAFRGCSDIRHINIYSGVTHIGDSAFRDCTGLTHLGGLGGIITSIGKNAFENCSSLTSFGIPDNVVSIETGTFRNCTGITSFFIPDGVISIGDQASENCSSLRSIYMPTSIISIGNSAFENCSSLISVTIPNSLTSIGNSAFENCSGLTDIRIPNNVTNLGDHAFKQCNGLTTFRVRWDTPLVINANVFEDVPLQNITLSVPSNAEAAYRTAPIWQDFGSYIIFIDDGVLEYTITDITNQYVSVKKYDNTCPTGDLTIPETITDNGLTYTVTSLEHNAFDRCASLQSIIIPNSVTDLGKNTFYQCSNLNNVILPVGLTKIGSAVFIYCASLTDIVLPESLTTIEDNAFQACSSLLSITIPDSVTSIGRYAFSLTGLMSFTIPNGTTSIEEATFWNSRNLTSVIIPDSVTSIGRYAFSECTSLKSISIPANVTSIGERAFDNNSSLSSVITHWSSPIAINANVFENLAIENIPLTIPSGSLVAYQAAAVWKDFGSFVLGITDFVMETIRLYPNPTSEFLKIELNGASQLKNSRIFNNLGQLVSEEKETQISVSNYSKGLYFAEIETNQGKVTKKFMVE